MNTPTPQITLNDDNAIPQLGFGVFQIPEDETVDAVTHALTTGYRLIDTAEAYGNERQVGEALKNKGLARDEVFVTTKLWNSHQGREHVRRAFDRSLSQLGLDHLDLYLIHWPVPSRDLYVETWQEFCDLRADGVVRSIGVSNFQIEHLERIIDATGVVPTVNQVELHPRLQQEELRAFHAEHGIHTEAWSPLGQGAVLEEQPIEEIASARERTPAQIILRWHLQIGNIVIPKSVTPARIEENFDVFDFELDEQEMDAIAQLDQGQRIGPDPDEFAVA
ncbi:MAG: aldo/keto reductase [Solirubrobacterales bacterium]|nr:aldo/keto reductase [Solirubrobacterales bacterium]